MAAARADPGSDPAGGARFFCTAGRGLEPFLMREVRARLEATQVSRAHRARVRAALPPSPLLLPAWGSGPGRTYEHPILGVQWAPPRTFDAC